jgi:hypothetical protein
MMACPVVCEVQAWIMWPTAAQVQSPSASLFIMPRWSSLRDQSTAAGGGGSAAVYFASINVRGSWRGGSLPSFRSVAAM